MSKLVTIVFVSLTIVFAVKYFDIKNQNNKLKKQLQLDRNMHVNELNEILNRYDVEILKNRDLLNRNKDRLEKNTTLSKKFDKIRYEVSRFKKANSYNLSSNNSESSVVLYKNGYKNKKARAFKKEVDSLKNIILNHSKNYKLHNGRANELNIKKRVLTSKNTDHPNTVSTSRNLTTKNVSGNAIKIVSNNIIETKRFNYAQQIKVCFTLLENNNVFRGNKDIYIQIINPNKSIVSKSDAHIELDNKSLQYSAKTNVFYDNEELDVCVFVDSDKDKLVKGDYEINIFSGSNIIGNTAFSLK
jgi:hypothetical protein